MRLASLSIQARINVTLLLVFILVLVASVSFYAANEKNLVDEMAEKQTLMAAESYFDGLNTMMLSGAMANRDILRKKVLAHEGVVEARIIRSEHVSKFYGPGRDEEKPVDALDEAALRGQAYQAITDTPEGRRLTVLTPLVASADYNGTGTNCLTCHQVSEGTVLGAVRIGYSLRNLDEKIDANVLRSGLVQLLMFAGGLVAMILLLRRLVIRPVCRLRGVIEEIERDSDLTRRIEVVSQDEVGTMSRALNGMLEKFHDSLAEVNASTRHLQSVAQRVSGVAETTVESLSEQERQTEAVVNGMREMESSVEQVASRALATAEASKGAADEAQAGAMVSTKALAGVDALMSSFDKASRAIQKLNEDSDQIGVVLDVIKNIAEQTNLLALNAAIEAARAGEQGRGFAVVADEVRTLANRTHESAQEIEKMIEQLQAGAGDAVRVMADASEVAKEEETHVEHAAESLGVIMGEVINIREMNNEIAEAVNAQSKLGQEVYENLENIKLLSEQTVQQAGENAGASEELAQLSVRLNELVGRFRL